MKKNIFIFLLALISATTICLGAFLIDSKTIIIKTAIYCNHCKECESCGGRIQRDLSFDRGILQVDLNEKQMTLTVQYNPKKTTPEEIRKKISMYGYDADDVKADSLAVSKLDECCLKK